MEKEQQFYRILSLIILILSMLLIVKYCIHITNTRLNILSFIWESLDLIWPIMGFAIIFEFLRKNRDKWGWGGLLFHFFILYCGIYYLIVLIQGFIGFTLEGIFLTHLLINAAISVLGWIGFLFYYD